MGGGCRLPDQNLKAQVVAGPSEAGVYTLGLAPHSTDKASVDKALAQLRADSRVRFAEPADEYEAP